MNKFYSPFSTDILYSDQNRVSNHDELLQWVIDLYNKSPVKDEGNFYHTGFTTYFYDDFTGHLDQIEIFTELKDTILEQANIYVANRYRHLAEYSVPLPSRMRPLIITNMWFNINPPGGYQGRHHHAMNLLGGTYYLDVPKDSGKIGFFDPNPFSYIHNQEPKAKNLIISDFDIITTAGDLLIWPGWMDHEISVNKTSNENRVTISFGINWGFHD